MLNMLTSNTDLPFIHPNLPSVAIETIPFQSKAINYLDSSNNQANLDSRSNADPDLIIDRLVRGNQQFVEMRDLNIYHRQSICLSAAARGKTPAIAVLNHTKLTTSIEALFGQKFGELFTVDALEPLATDREIGAIESSIIISGVKVLVVLVDRFPERDRSKSRLDPDRYQYFKLKIKPNQFLVFDLTTLRKDRHHAQVATDLSQQIAKLKTSPLLLRSIESGNLKIVGGSYDRERGTVTLIESPNLIQN
jgi:carbonic anhydrase